LYDSEDDQGLYASTLRVLGSDSPFGYSHPENGAVVHDVYEPVEACRAVESLQRNGYVEASHTRLQLVLVPEFRSAAEQRREQVTVRLLPVVGVLLPLLAQGLLRVDADLRADAAGLNAGVRVGGVHLSGASLNAATGDQAARRAVLEELFAQAHAQLGDDGGDFLDLDCTVSDEAVLLTSLLAAHVSGRLENGDAITEAAAQLGLIDVVRAEVRLAEREASRRVATRPAREPGKEPARERDADGMSR
jgi:hypothetical protein